MLSERSHAEKTADCIIFFQHSGKGKIMAKVRGTVVGTRGGRRVLITKEHFSGDENILYHICGCGYTTIYICQDS